MTDLLRAPISSADCLDEKGCVRMLRARIVVVLVRRTADSVGEDRFLRFRAFLGLRRVLRSVFNGRMVVKQRPKVDVRPMCGHLPQIYRVDEAVVYPEIDFPTKSSAAALDIKVCLLDGGVAFERVVEPTEDLSSRLVATQTVRHVIGVPRHHVATKRDISDEPCWRLSTSQHRSFTFVEL